LVKSGRPVTSCGAGVLGAAKLGGAADGACAQAASGKVSSIRLRKPWRTCREARLA
jgi:hypothetical protein